MEGVPSGVGPGAGPGAGPGPRGELEKLSKENFNLKLRIFYLEERVAKLRKGGETDESLEQEVLEQKVLLEEKQQELDERNLLLVKARNAIEGLHTDLALCRAELEEARNAEIPVEALREKEQEIDALRHKIKELDDRDRKRLEDVLTLNEQVRELEPEKKRAADLDRTLDEANAALADAEKTILQRDACFEELRAEHAKAARENETMRAQLVENARALGEQRNQEAANMGKLQEAARKEEARVSQLTQLLKQCEQERDQSERAAAVAERKIEDLARELDETRAAQDDLQAGARRLERENQRLRETYATKEHSLRREGEIKQDELRKAQSEKVLALTSEVAELRGKLSALAFARDAAYQQAEGDRKRLENMEARLQKAEAEAKEAQARLAAETRAGKEASAQLREALANSVSREKEFQRHVRLREAMGGAITDTSRHHHAGHSAAGSSVDHATAGSSRGHASGIPDHASFVSSSSSLFGDDLVVDDLADHRSERPEPRPWGGDDSALSRRSGGDGGNVNAGGGGQSPRSRASTSQRRSRASRGVPLADEVVLRLQDLQDLKNAFTKNGLEMERKWRAKLKQIVGQLERTEAQLAHAESKLAFFMQSMQTMATSSNAQLQGQTRSLEKRYTELLAELRTERKEKEDRSRILEARIHRGAEEKEALHDQLGSARERAALFEGEARQARAEVEALRQEKHRLDKRLEELHGSQATVEECNRVLSLELEDRGRRIEDLTESQTAMKQQLRILRDDLHAKKQTVATLERKLDHAARKLEARDSQLRESKLRLDRALLSSSPSASSSQRHAQSAHQQGGGPPAAHGYDEFERKILRQVKETERAIKTSSLASQHRGAQAASGLAPDEGYFYEVLRRGEEAFAGMLDAVTALVEKTHTLVSRHGINASYDLRDLLHENERLAQDLQHLGDKMGALYQRLVADAAGQRNQSYLGVSGTPRGGSASGWRREPASYAGSRPSSANASRGPPSLGANDMLKKLDKINADIGFEASQLRRS